MPMAWIRTEKTHILVLPPQLISILSLGKLMNLTVPQSPLLESGHFSCRNYKFP